MILTLEKLKEYRRITKSSDCKNLDIYLREAQQIDLKDFLGYGLYYDMIENIGDQKYQDFVYGVRYDDDIDSETVKIDYKGLEPLLAYWAYARILNNHHVVISKTGITTGTYNQDEPLTDRQRDNLIKENKKLADSYKSEVEHFLCEKETDYPLWCGFSNKPSNFGFFAL